MNLILQTIPSTIISELLANSHFDGIVLDTEHGCFNNESLYSCIQVVTLYKKLCFVRFTDLNKQLIRMCLDAGISGAIFSTVETYEIGRQIVRYCRYPLCQGDRGCGLVRENQWGELKLGTNKTILIGQIETKNGVDNIDEILDCGFDMFVIGPYDLSNSLNCAGNWDDVLYKSYISEIYYKIELNKLGLFLPTKKMIENFKQSNQKRPELLIWGMDTDFIKEGINSINF